MAEWLRSGLQNRVHRFNSGRCLQSYRSRRGEFSRKSHDFGSIISLSPNGGIGIRVRLKIEWRNPYGFKSHFGHQQDDLKKRGHFLFKNKLDIMIIAIDDSGDPGLKMDKGSSSYFVIVAVVFLTDHDAEATALKIERFRQTLKWKDYHEFKFRKTSPEIRKAFFQKLIAVISYYQSLLWIKQILIWISHLIGMLVAYII